MVRSLRRAFTIPVFDDQERTRQAELFFRTLYAILALALSALALTVLVYSDAHSIAAHVLTVISLLALMIIARRGQIILARWLLCAVIWLAFARTIWAIGGTLNPFYGGFTLVILIAGVVIDGRAALIVAGCSIALGGLYALNDPRPYVQGAWLSMSTLFAATAYFLSIANTVTATAFRHLRRDEHALIHLNQELYKEIAGHQRTAQALKLSESSYRTLLDALPVPIVVGSFETGVILYVNSAAIRLYGANEPDDLLGQQSRRFLVPAYSDRADQRLNQLREGRSLPPVEYQLLRLDGGMIQVEISSIPVTYNGESAGLAAIVDLTDYLRAENQRMEAERLRLDLEQSQRIIMLREQFVSMVSHEFRGPLTVITMSSEILESYLDRLPLERRTEHFAKIRAQARRMEEMIDELLMLSKSRAGLLEFNPTRVDLRALATEMVADLAVRHHDSHRFIFTSDDLLQPFPADEKLLRHIFSNLLSNAVKYSPNGGEVRIDLRQEPDQMVIAISDQGIGIPEDHRPQMFAMFHRASNVGAIRGTGLGLAIVQECVSAHGGTITFQSEVSVGTTFTITLPLERQPSAPLSARVETASSG
jgi:PAS domain S-box-containing protein